MKTLHVKNIFVSICIVFFVYGCAIRMVKEETAVLTIKSNLMINFSSDRGKFKKKILIAIKRPDKIRFEIKGFWNEPLFILLAKGDTCRVYFINENAYFEGNFLGNIVDLVDLFTGNSAGTMEVKFNGEILQINSKYANYETINGYYFPLRIESLYKDFKMVFNYLNPTINSNVNDSIFELELPKSARKITIEKTRELMEEWIK